MLARPPRRIRPVAEVRRYADPIFAGTETVVPYFVPLWSAAKLMPGMGFED